MHFIYIYKSRWLIETFVMISIEVARMIAIQFGFANEIGLFMREHELQ